MMRAIGVMLILMCGWWAVAQPRIEFEKTQHDFGKIKEVDGAVEYSFIFRNIGTAPLKIGNVQASCGCTTPEWTTEAIAPGESGFITARYNTANRPGAFTKSLQVTTNGQPASTTLYIRGHVEPKPRTIEDELPVVYGALRLQSKSFNYGRITNEKIVVKTFDVYNRTDEVVNFLPESVVLPEHVGIAFHPVHLPTGTKGEIVITYDPTKKQELGYQTEKITFRTDEKAEPEKVLYLMVTVEEYFPPMSEEELAKAPRLVIDRRSHDFGKALSGTSIETTFTVRNDGKQPLAIRALKPNCDCVVATLDKDTLAPGESAKMKVVFDTKNLKGRQYKNISIFSNDPRAPSQVVSIKALL